MQCFAPGNAVAGGCCNYLFCTSREWYVWRCVGFRARNPYGLLRSSLAFEPATFTARICMHGLAGFLHARASGHGGVKRGKVTVDTQGEKISHWRARLRGRAGGSVWSTVGREQRQTLRVLHLGKLPQTHRGEREDWRSHWEDWRSHKLAMRPLCTKLVSRASN